MTELTIFNFNSNEVRVISQGGEPWFVLTDVCKVLELSNPSKVANDLDEDALTTSEVTDSLGRRQKVNLVNEAGLYEVIFKSRKPEAKQFRRWVTHEVLPAIRRHGAYMTPERIEETLLNPDTIIKLAQNLKTEIQARMKAEAQIKADRPKVLFADSVSVSPSTILVGELAKILKGNGVDIGQNRLFEWMRTNGYLSKQKGDMWNKPTQYSMNLELFEVKESTHSQPDGTVRIVRTTKVTGKGQQYFINKFLAREATA